MSATVVDGEEELGVQRRCPRCGDWWPLDATFWISITDGRPGHAWCRACLAEYQQARRAQRTRTSVRLC